MRNTSWHVYVRRSITVYDEKTPVTVEPGEYPMREVDLTSYELGDRSRPLGRLLLSDLLKLRRSGAITIEGAFP
jgi:hypothetical protein